MRRSARTAACLLALLVAATALPTFAEEPLGLVDWLESRGENSSFAGRKARYEALFPDSSYGGTLEQNMALLNALREGARAGAASPGSPPGHPGPHAMQVVQIGWRVTLDRRTQILDLSVPKDHETGSMLQAPVTVEPTLSPTMPRLGGFISAAALGQKAKQFDDGLYAAIEGAVLAGHGAFPGTQLMLTALARNLTPTAAPDSAATVIHAASHLGRGWTPNQHGHVKGPLREALEDFDADATRSKTLGIYTWSSTLRSCFRQDRMLQTPLKRDASVAAVLAAMRADVQAAEVYESWLELVEGLTNPFPYDDLRVLLRGGTPTGESLHVLPPSRSHESELAKRLWRDRRVPEGANLMDLLVEGVRSGRLSLAPERDSGWTDRQTWALEPLLRPETTPEAERLRYDETYRGYLEQLFRALLALVRETHLKQVESIRCGAWRPPPRVLIRPRLTVEPLPTHYLRRAEAYAFVRGVLERAFGAGSLAALHRQTPDDPKIVDLDTELRFMERLFRGAAERAFRETGSVGARPDKDARVNLAAFDAWRAGFEHDPDLGRDARMMVPVFFDEERQKTKVWVFLGWSRRPLHIKFVERPTIVSRESIWPGVEGKPRIDFESQSTKLAYPVSAEVYVTKLLDREAFRAHCDRHKTRSAILTNLR